MAAPGPPGGGKQIAGIEPLMFWALVGAAVLGGLYFLVHGIGSGSSSAAQQPMVAADGAPLTPAPNGTAGSATVPTGAVGGGTSSTPKKKKAG